MNRIEKAICGLRADMARNPDGLEKNELDYLLASITDESDRSLAGVAKLFGLDLEPLEERAGILEHDAGLSRIAANRRAVTLALQDLDPGISDRAARWIFNNALAILDWEKSSGATRRQTIETMQDCMTRQLQQHNDAVNALSGRKEAS